MVSFLGSNLEMRSKSLSDELQKDSSNVYETLFDPFFRCNSHPMNKELWKHCNNYKLTISIKPHTNRLALSHIYNSCCEYGLD